MIRPRTVCNASSSVRYPCSTPRANARRAAAPNASASISIRVSAFPNWNPSSCSLNAPIAYDAKYSARPIFNLGRIATDNPPTSIAPMVDPGVRRYESPKPSAGSMVTLPRLCSASRSSTESEIGSLRSYSRRSISRIVRPSRGLVIRAVLSRLVQFAAAIASTAQSVEIKLC